MKIKVTVSTAELNEMNMTKDDLHDHVVDALDDAAPQIVGFDVEVEVTE